LDPWRFGVGLAALAFSALIQFAIAYCFGMLSFWFLEIQGFVILSMAVEAVLGGQVFPLDLTSPNFFAASMLLPYPYQMYFPAAILTGRFEYSESLWCLGIEACWAALLIMIARGLWLRGLRRHTAVGG